MVNAPLAGEAACISTYMGYSLWVAIVVVMLFHEVAEVSADAVMVAFVI